MDKSEAATNTESSWARIFVPNPTARLRLLCFPYAGAGASLFRDWPALLPPEVELVAVQLPGREERHREAPFKRLDELASVLVSKLSPWLEQDCVLYGHSMGALIAFALTRELRRRGLPLPRMLLISSRPAPQLPPPQPPTYLLSDEDALAAVRGHVDDPAVRAAIEEPKWRVFFLPIVRADIELCETFGYQSEPPLEVPMHVFGAEEDRAVSLQQLEAWREQAGAAYSFRLFPGGHYFIRSDAPGFLGSLSHKLEALLRGFQAVP